jgi:hypothetical protein
VIIMQSSPKEITIDRNAKYENLELGKRATARTRHNIGYGYHIL